MRRLWAFCNWSQYLHGEYRCGVRLRFDQGVDPEVRRACKQFLNWLREWYEFPVRVPIYFKNQKVVYTRSGEPSSAIFSGPYELDVEPYIRIAVGDYPDLLVARGQDDALAAILGSICHELTHYFQWIKLHDLWCSGDADKKMERQALYYADVILDDYACYVDHP